MADPLLSDARLWKQATTADGTTYYHHTTLDITQEEVPDCLAAGQADEWGGGRWVWVPDDHEGYVAARVVEEAPDGNPAVVELLDGPTVTLRKKERPLTIPLRPGSLSQTRDDLVQMGEIDEGVILHNLRKRFMNDEIYTNIGPILIVVNPYRWLKLYTDDIMDAVHNRGVDILRPHIFNIADDAFRSLSEAMADGLDGNQSILISGESGAGKTEATKQALKYLAYCAGSGETSGVEQKLLAANPLLEAFGNAATLRNHNSSRFGKWMEVFFDSRRRIVGAKINNYLLEKSRVSHQIAGERNFHIFYQLCQARPVAEAFGLGLAEDYAFINKRIVIDDAHFSDARDFDEVLEAMTMFNIREGADRQSIFRLVAGILHFGNLEFAPAGDDESRITNPDTLAAAASLFCVPEAALERAVLFRTLSFKRQEDVVVPLTPAQASDNRNALARTLYNSLFNWLVVRVNEVLAPKERASNLHLIGILDIFGFEIFENNSFEQLCINFANEKLQQHFNQHTFKMEQQLYMDEGISFEEVKFIDNQPCLDLLERKPHGILIMLDEELLAPSGSDDRFLDKLNERHSKKTERFSMAFRTPNTFNIDHYAGRVTYDVRGFLEKNKDTIEKDLLTLVSASTDPFINHLFAAIAAGDSKSRKHSTAYQFRNQLGSLMKELQSTTPHYVRCIKPNSVFKPRIFHGHDSLLQLRYSGVFEAVRIRQTGFPFRYRHAEFMRRYGVFNQWRRAGSEAATCRDILESVAGDFSAVQIGRTRVLYRAKMHRALEVRLSVIMNRMAVTVQAAFRGFRARKLYAKMVEVHARMSAAMATLSVDTLRAAIAEARAMWFQLRITDEAELLCARLLEERSLNAKMESLVSAGNPEANYEAILATINRAEELGIPNPHILTLRNSIATIHERKVAIGALKSGTINYNRGDLERGLAEVARLGIVAEGLVAEARRVLQVLQAEEAFVAQARRALASTQDEVSLLRDAVAAGGAVKLHTPEAKDLFMQLNAVLAVREALGARDWSTLEEAVAKALRLGLGDVADIVAAREGLALREQMAEVAARLAPAVAAKILGLLEEVVVEAKALGMDTSLYSDWRDEVARAAETAARHRSLLGTLVSYSEPACAAIIGQLDSTVRGAQAFGFADPADVAVLAKAEAVLELRRALEARDFEALEAMEARLRKTRDLWGVHDEVVAYADGLALRRAMAAHADVLEACAEARDAPALDTALRVADDNEPLALSSSYWSSWGERVAELAKVLAKHKAVVGGLERASAPAADMTQFEASVEVAPVMEKAMREAKAFGLKTEDDVNLEAFVGVLLGLRMAVRERDWRALQKAVAESAQLGFGTHTDVTYVHEGLGKRAQMSRIAARLTSAVKVADAHGLVEALNAASAAKMASSYWSTWGELVAEAQAKLTAHRVTMQRLSGCLGPTSGPVIEQLASAVEAAEAFGFGMDDDVAYVRTGALVLRVRRAMAGAAYDELETAVCEAEACGLGRAHAELREGRTVLDARAAMARHVPALVRATGGRNEGALAAAVREGRTLGMDSSPHSAWVGEMGEAKAVLARHRRCMMALRAALQARAALSAEPLRAAIAEAEDFGLVSAAEVAVLEQARVALRLRVAKAAEAWAEVESALDAALVAQLDTAETVGARRGLAKMQRIDKLAYKLGAAMEVRHVEIVEMCLVVAEEEDMEWSPWSRWRDMVGDAREVAASYRRVRAGLVATLQVDEVRAGLAPAFLAAHERALDEAAEFGLELKEDVDLFATSKIMFFVRDAWARRSFVELEQHLKTAVAIGVQSAELAAAAEELHGFAQMAGMASLLESATADSGNYVRGTLRLVIKQAEGLGFEQSVEFRGVWEAAVGRQAEIDAIDGLVERGAESGDAAVLREAVGRAEAIGYGRAERVEGARALAEAIEGAHAEAEGARARGDVKGVRVAVRKLKTLGVGEASWSQYAAEAVEREYSGGEFLVEAYGRMRSGEAFAASKWFGRRGVAAGMLVHASKSMPTSLLALEDAGEVQTAVAAFDRLLTFYGLRGAISESRAAGEALVQLGMSASGSELASELYFQVIKQLTESGSSELDDVGWSLMAAYASRFLPSRDAYPYIEWWLKAKGGERGRAVVRALKGLMQRLGGGGGGGGEGASA